MAATQPNEDLFESSRMSFGEHLEELRKVLIKSVIGIAIGCVFGFLFANQVVEFLTKPLTKAISQFHVNEAEKRIVEKEGFLDPELSPWLKGDSMAPEIIHVDPGMIVAMLRELSPDFLEGIELNPYGFQPGHFHLEKLPQVCERLAEHEGLSESHSTRLGWLWEQLDAGQKESVRAAALQEEANGETATRIATVFNHLAGLKELSSSDPFRPLVEQPASSWSNLLVPAKENPLELVKKKLDAEYSEDLNRRLNRVLITAQFGDLMPEVRKDMYPLPVWRRIDVQPQSLETIEPFLIWLKAGLILGLVLASPWVFYQLWSFVASGLYPHEKGYIYIFLPVSMLLFFSGVCLAFFFVFEPVLAFLFSFNAQMGISPEPRIMNWLNFVLLLPVGFGIAFQLPLVMLFLNRIGIMTVDAYLSKWRVAIMVIFVVAMMLTPADPISMILLAVPLTGLYFLGIAMCKWLPHRGNPFEERANAAAQS